jgi:hypothetical protein
MMISPFRGTEQWRASTESQPKVTPGQRECEFMDNHVESVRLKIYGSFTGTNPGSRPRCVGPMNRKPGCTADCPRNTDSNHIWSSRITFR